MARVLTHSKSAPFGTLHYTVTPEGAPERTLDSGQMTTVALRSYGPLKGRPQSGGSCCSLPPIHQGPTGTLARGASRHALPTQNRDGAWRRDPSPPSPLARAFSSRALGAPRPRRQPQTDELRDRVVAESVGRAKLQEEPDANIWSRKVFTHVDGEDETSRNFLMPAEFAMLVAGLSRELGDDWKSRGFRADFQKADKVLDGRVSIDEWQAYSLVFEKAFGSKRCKQAAQRFLGAHEAELRRKLPLKKCRAGIYMFDGYNPEASLQILRSCASWNEPGLVRRIRTALDLGADPNSGLADPTFHGYTPLIFLAMATPEFNNDKLSKEVSDAIHLLIEAKADPHRPNEKMDFGGWPPLRFAAQLQSRPAIEALLQHVDVGEIFSWAAGENVQHVMLDELSRACSKQAVARIAAKDFYDNTATVLMSRFASSIVGGNLTAQGARKLMRGENDDETVLRPGARADPNGAGLEGITPLMNVIMKGHVETARALIAGRADPMQADSSGATALHHAAARLELDIVRDLLAAKGEPHVEDQAGFSPWMLVGDAVAVIGDEEKRDVQDMLQLLRPHTFPDELLTAGEKSWQAILGDEKPTLESLNKKLRLKESLFFNMHIVRGRAQEGRRLRSDLIRRTHAMIINLLRSDPLKGDKKVLTKYLLQATMGPDARAEVGHVRREWAWRSLDNREGCRAELEVAVKDLLSGFADECNALKNAIVDLANEDVPECVALLDMAPDVVCVPETWQERDPFWRAVQERQLLRFDPPWAREIHDGVTCCRALLRLDAVKNLAQYAHYKQVHHATMEEMLARGYVAYSELCNAKFQELMKRIVRDFAENECLDLQEPKSIVSAKKLPRLLEKTRMAREERGDLEWPGLSQEYLRSSHCFDILDTVRMSFTCRGLAASKAARESLFTVPEDRYLTWTVNHAPPEREDGERSEGAEFPELSFQSLANGGTYVGPDFQGTPQELGGDASMYFIIDLGKPVRIDKLEMINAWGDDKQYYLLDYEVGISNDICTFKYRGGTFPVVSSTKVQDVRVEGTGRYIRFNMKTYGPKSVAISRFRVVKADDEEDEVRAELRKQHIKEQVTSCMKLLDRFRSLTLERDSVCVLRQKSGFSNGLKAAGGYADVKLLMLADLGTHKAFDDTEVPLVIVGEVQLILQGYMEVKDRMHLAYEVDRGSFDRS
eukprot:TRINITY_DN26603_c1_g2_i1.p1 TRINITY_DN26603_c1_g2~~TRINITY_DN26603_c1_g2_i1.p1  ORF type:complete len:1178 (-),score=195.91 TRINITY_DN26603_c1_g2_i1:265-3798(-)